MDARWPPGDLELTAVFAALPTATAVFAADPPRFTVLAASDAFLSAAQRPRDGVVGRSLAEALPDTNPKPALRASLMAALQTGAAQRMDRQQHDLPRPDGAREPRYWDAVSIPVTGSDGAVRYVLHQTSEVTPQMRDEAAPHASKEGIAGRRLAEQALRESEERLRSLLSIPTVGVLFFRLDGSMLDANGAIERMLGYTLEELRALAHWSVLTPPEFAEITAHGLAEVVERGRGAPYEKQWLRKDGSRMWGLCAPMRLAGSGCTAECVEFIIDITRAREVEAAQRATERRLEQELAAARTLQMVSSELISDTEPRTLYTKLVDAAIQLLGADGGNLQMLDRDGSLRLLASRSADPQSERHERARSGRARSTPLVARDGRAVGTLATHWRRSLEPSGNELALFDVLAREAADLLDRTQAQTALREHSELLKGQHEALTAAVNGAALEASLGALVRTVTDVLGADVRAAFYLAGGDGTTLHHVIGMSDEYASLVDGFKISPEPLACSLAMHSGQPVLNADVQTDARWEPWRWTAERCGYRACWIFPIHSTAGTLVGTLAVYWPGPREASARELELASLLTNTAAIIIARHRESEVRLQAEAALRSSLAEREALLRELHHRTKNNLQVITSLLEMQARQVNDSTALRLLTEARNRVSAIGTIHELLYRSTSLSRVDLRDYAEQLIPHIVSLYARSTTIGISVVGDSVTADLARAVPIGLLLNELVSNVCKHAFPANSGGQLTVALRESAGQIHLSVTDTGTGPPTGFSPGNSKTLGLQLVQMLVKQLGGTLELRHTGGTTVDVHLPA